MAKDVYVANLNPGVVRNEYHATLIDMFTYDLCTSQRIACYSPRLAGGCLGIFRNLSVGHFLELGETDGFEQLEWYLSLDSDIQLYPALLDDLLSHADSTETPIVAGTYYMSLEGGIYPAIFDMIPGDDGAKHMEPRYKARDSIPENTLIECCSF